MEFDTEDQVLLPDLTYFDLCGPLDEFLHDLTYFYLCGDVNCGKMGRNKWYYSIHLDYWFYISDFIQLLLTMQVSQHY